jgi:hypothetical protein
MAKAYGGMWFTGDRDSTGKWLTGRQRQASEGNWLTGGRGSIEKLLTVDRGTEQRLAGGIGSAEAEVPRDIGLQGRCPPGAESHRR